MRSETEDHIGFPMEFKVITQSSYAKKPLSIVIIIKSLQSQEFLSEKLPELRLFYAVSPAA